MLFKLFFKCHNVYVIYVCTGTRKRSNWHFHGTIKVLIKESILYFFYYIIVIIYLIVNIYYLFVQNTGYSVYVEVFVGFYC